MLERPDSYATSANKEGKKIIATNAYFQAATRRSYPPNINNNKNLYPVTSTDLFYPSNEPWPLNHTTFASL